MGKIAVGETRTKQRHNPLYRDIQEEAGTLRKKSHVKSSHDEGTDEDYIDATTSRKIVQLARKQQEELEEEEKGHNVPGKSFLETYMSYKEDNDTDSVESEEFSDFGEDAEDDLNVDDKDRLLFEKAFLPSSSNNGIINLADKVTEKIQERELAQKNVEKPDEGVMLPPKVIDAYQKIGQILSNYTHGKLPKLFKVIPSLRNWEDVLYVTDPESWTPHAVYEATRLFVSNLLATEAQKFVENVLLERFRSSIEEAQDHALNYHLYRALKKAMYKPAAFFKGFLFPLVDNGCTVREAKIAGSVLAKVSVPALHSSVALSKLLEREFKPSTVVFIRILIEKKYALPYQTVDELVFYFMSFRGTMVETSAMLDDNESNSYHAKLPVVWHKAFLAFAQRYKNDITDDQRDFLLETVRQRFHHAIGPEIRKELLSGKARVTSQPVEDNIMDTFI